MSAYLYCLCLTLAEFSVIATLQKKVSILPAKYSKENILCLDFFEGCSSVVDPARFRLPVGAAPIQPMIIDVTVCERYAKNNSRASCKALSLVLRAANVPHHISQISYFMKKKATNVGRLPGLSQCVSQKML